MTKNIKEIGKELLGKSLNSFHRKTGLTQLEKNNEMQDGILNGILSQVDDAYIEKTEQSNVMHLNGSSDGVVVLDSIEGNTMVNLITSNSGESVTLTQGGTPYILGKKYNCVNMKSNTDYTLILQVDEYTGKTDVMWGLYFSYQPSNKTIMNIELDNKVGIVKCKFNTTDGVHDDNTMYIKYHNDAGANSKVSFKNVMLLEGDYTNKEVNFFEGLQSSFEEKVNDEGKYEIEILSQNRNLCNSNCFFKEISLDDGSEHNVDTIVTSDYIRVNPNKTYNAKLFDENNKSYSPLTNRCYDINKKYLGSFELNNLPSNCAFFRIRHLNKEGIDKTKKYRFMLTESSINNTSYIEPKQNKIKLLINEPLRAIGDLKDRLCIRDGKLVIERNVGQITLDGSETWGGSKRYGIYTERHNMARLYDYTNGMICDKLQVLPSQAYSTLLGVTGYAKSQLYQGENWIYVMHPNLETTTDMRNWLSQNPLKIVYPLAEPIYEEVLNEYGEPLLLEGYENGTLYIDSTIVPTTSVRYTPKMESFKTIREVKDNNIMLTTDINNAIIPYMLEVDMMILEKEMAIMSHKNIRKIGEKDMTNMQKRTYDMLARLIKGKTLNEQECKTRVTVYLNAGKITDEQAKELNFLIDEIYA